MLLSRRTLFLLVLGGYLLTSSVSGVKPDSLPSPLVAESKRNNVVAAKINPSFHAGLVQASTKRNPMSLKNFPLLGEEGSDTVDLEVVPFDILTSDSVTVVVKPNGKEETLRPSVRLVRGQVKGNGKSNVVLGFTESGVNGFIQIEDQLYIVAEDRRQNRKQNRKQNNKQNNKQNDRITYVYNTAKVDMPVGKELKDELIQVPGGGRQLRDGRSGLGGRELQGDRCYTVAVDTLDDFLSGQSREDKMNYVYTIMAATSLLFSGFQDWHEDNIYISNSFQMYIAVGYIRVYEGGANDWYTPSSECIGQIIKGDCLLRDSLVYWEGSASPTVQPYHVLITLTEQCGPYGGVTYFDKICTDHRYAVAGCLKGSFPLPLEPDGSPTSGTWDLTVVAHELGHQFGALHTHTYGIDTCKDDCDVPFGKPTA